MGGGGGLPAERGARGGRRRGGGELPAVGPASLRRLFSSLRLRLAPSAERALLGAARAAILWRSDGVGFSSLARRGRRACAGGEGRGRAGRRRVVGRGRRRNAGFPLAQAKAESSRLLPIGPERGRGRACCGLRQGGRPRGAGCAESPGRAAGGGGGGADGRAGRRVSRSELRAHSHERLPRLHREAEPGRQGEGCGEVLQGIRPHPGHRSEEGVWVCGECRPPYTTSAALRGPCPLAVAGISPACDVPEGASKDDAINVLG